MIPLVLLLAAAASAADDVGALLEKAKKGATASGQPAAAGKPAQPPAEVPTQCRPDDLDKIYEVWGEKPEKALQEIYDQLVANAKKRGHAVALPLKVDVHAVRPPGASYLILPDRFAGPGGYSPAGEASMNMQPPVLRVGCGLFEWLKRDYDDVERRWSYRMRDQAAFVLAHELGHHVGGHLQAMADERARLDKAKDADIDKKLDRKQFSLEREADIFAVELACGGGFDAAAGFGAMMNAIPYYAGFGITVADSHGAFDKRARFIRAVADCCGEKGLDRSCIGSRPY